MGVVVLLRTMPVVVIDGHGRCAQLHAVALAHRNIDHDARINALRALCDKLFTIFFKPCKLHECARRTIQVT